jgi:flagellar export protein FliJ
MKRFAFRLERLKRLRDAARREARAGLAQAIGIARERGCEREDNERSLEQALVTELPADRSVSAEALRQLSDWREGRRLLVRHAAGREAEAREAVDEAAREHAEAARAHRVLERLRERRFRRWLLEAETEERKFLDEVHQLRVVRRRGDRHRER